MTSLQIAYFLKVTDCMSFSQAAEELYVSQPSVSRQIKLLEEELGYRLFDRTRKNLISLTAAGMVFRDTFRRSQQGLEAAMHAARELARHESLRLRVGIGQNWDMIRLLQTFRDQVGLRYPQAELFFENSSFRQLHEKLRSGALDIILCTKTSLTDFDALEMVQVANLEGRAYVLRGLLRPEGEPLRIEDFEGRRLMVLPESEAPMTAELIQLQFLAHQVKTDLAYVPNRSTIWQSLLMGEGFSVFDQYISFSGDPRLTYFRLEDYIPICAVWRRNNQNPLIRLFSEVALRELSGDTL